MRKYDAHDKPNLAHQPAGVKSGLSEKAKITESPEDCGMGVQGKNQMPMANKTIKAPGGHKIK